MTQHRSLAVLLLLLVLITGCVLPKLPTQIPNLNEELPTATLIVEKSKTILPPSNTSTPPIVGNSSNTEPPSATVALDSTATQLPPEPAPIFYPELFGISFSSEVSLAPSPSQSRVQLQNSPIPPGEPVQLIARDRDGAWYLILYKNTLGWMSALYIGFGSGNIQTSTINTDTSISCNQYLGSLLSIARSWESNVDGNVQMEAIAYLPVDYPEADDWRVIIGDTGRTVVPDIVRANLDEGGQIATFSAEINDISVGEKISITNRTNGSTFVPFQASFYTPDCSNLISALPSDPSNMASNIPTLAPTIRVITMVVVSTVSRPSPPKVTGATPGKIPSCPGAPRPRLELNEDAKVCTKKAKVNLREGAGKRFDILVQQNSQSVVWVLDGPVCSGNAYWWYVRNKAGTKGWMMEGGDKTDPYYLCPN